MFRVALTHDIDRVKKTYQFVTKPIRALLNGRYKEFGLLLKTFAKEDNYWNFDKIIHIESKLNVKSTFFFLNESIKFNILNLQSFYLSLGRYDIHDHKIVQLIKWLDENGWEIGVHGSFNSYKNINLLKHEKEVLEKIVGHQIIGIRQHHLNLCATTWQLQNFVGFKYDSSLGSNDFTGFIDNRTAPFHPLNNEFTVIPQVVMDACFMGNTSRWSELDGYIDICKSENAILVINFHNHVFNEEEFPGYMDAYIKIIEICKDQDAIFRTLSDHLTNMKLLNE